MDFLTYTTMRDWTRRASPEDRLAHDIGPFYKQALAEYIVLELVKRKAK